MKLLLALGFSALFATALVACSSGQDGDGNGGSSGNGDYVSANPGNPSGSRNGDLLTPGADAGTSTGSGGTASNGAAEDGDEAARAIEEADIVKLGESTLYALSQYGGLSVIDIGTRDQLSLLGRFKTDAMPFEMYLRGSVVIGLFNDWGSYEYDEATSTWSWAQSSRVLLLDTSDPLHIEQLASFRVPGAISDSRIVGDVLYVVGYEDGYCWGCAQDAPGTTIISLDVSDPLQVTQIDQLRYQDQNGTYGGWRRSVTVTEERMYVGGVEYSSDGSVGSTIHVIDISDPGGELVPGARVEAEGQIQSRWQMDEYEGVLRVLSQTPSWQTDLAPVVQTWQVNSANSLAPLGRVELSIPVGEQLQSARFDGPRGYAITFLQTDPLFTIDLSDPANPLQAGELEMPGFLYHMEPRGNRMLGLGYDSGNTDGAVTVSLFDVTDISAPTMLSRVNFGADWGWLPEDQDRIHKAFNVLDELGMILVPFESYGTSGPEGCSTYQSGVQLIDWQADQLTERGIAATSGRARRGLLHDERLFTVSDERVQTFDIGDRDNPVGTADLPLLSNVTQSAIMGDHVARLTSNWWTGAPRLEVTTLQGAESAVATGSVELASALSPKGACGYSYSYARKLFASGQFAYVLYDTSTETGNASTVAVVDIADPTQPAVVGTHQLPGISYDTGAYSYYGATYSANLAPSGSDVVQVGTTLAQLRSVTKYSPTSGETISVKSFVDVVDLSDPQSPKVTTLEVPAGLGNTGLIDAGNVIAFSHFEAANPDASKVRFYLDRLDVSNPQAPSLLAKLNIPGSLLDFDSETNGVISVDYQALQTPVANYTECYETYGYAASFDAVDDTLGDSPGTCLAIKQSLKLVRLTSLFALTEGSYALASGEYVGQSATGSDRTFVTLSGSGGYAYGYGYADCFDCFYGGPIQTVPVPVLTIAGLSSGDFATGRVEIDGGDYWSTSQLAASGQRAIMTSGWRGKLSVVDGSDAAAPRKVKEVAIHGYVSDLDITGNTALVSLGYDGSQLVDLGD